LSSLLQYHVIIVFVYLLFNSGKWDVLQEIQVGLIPCGELRCTQAMGLRVSLELENPILWQGNINFRIYSVFHMCTNGNLCFQESWP